MWYGATGQARRAAASVPHNVAFQAKPQIARRKLQELRDLGVRFSWATGDEVYGRYAVLRADHEKNGEAYVSLVFWAWIIGLLGALLAVPLTLLAKTLLVDIDPRARWAQG